MNKIILSLIVSSFIITVANSNEVEGLDDFESLLNDVSDIATKKSINVDYLPSVVSVVHANTYIDAGVQNVGEALGMLPGIQMQLNFLGQPITTIRGFKNPEALISDKIKILVDGVSINNEAAATSGFYMDFPMQLVERIEVLRGPASTVYGAGAFYGAINIITKLGNQKDENHLYASVGSYKYGTAGANLATSAGDWKIFTDAFYAQNDKSIVQSAATTDEAMENLSIGLKLVNGNFEFLTRYKSSLYGNFYAFKGDNEPNRDKGHLERYFFSELSYKTSVNSFDIEAKVNFSNRELDGSAYFLNDVNTIAYLFSIVDVDMQEAFHVRDHQKERNIEAEAIVTFPEIASNDIHIGIGIRSAKLTTNYFYSSVEDAITQNLDSIQAHPNYDSFKFREDKEIPFWSNPTNTETFTKTSRTVKYGYIQDLISVNKDTDVILGVRADNYADIDTKFSTRAGLVYRMGDTLIGKLLYGSSFRAPSFYEAYTAGHINYRRGVETLLPEETQTYEVAFVYLPDFNNKLSLNLYYSQLSNVIDVADSSDSTVGYQNMKDRVTKGVEFEYYFHPKLQHNLYFNATFVDAQYTVPESKTVIDQQMPDISPYMFKGIYIYSPTQKLSFGTAAQFYSKTTQNDSRVYDTTVEKQYIIDETITYKFSSSSQLRLSIKNLLGKDLRMPSYLYREAGGVYREGRNFFLNYSHQF